MAHCVNIKHPDVVKLATQMQEAATVVAAKIALWQEDNGLDKWPTPSDLGYAANTVNYQLKAVDILLSDKAKQVFDKGNKNNWSLDKMLTELAIPKEQKQLLLDLGITNREQLAIELSIKYGYTVEVNTTKSDNSNDNYEFKTTNSKKEQDDLIQSGWVLDYVGFGGNRYKKEKINRSEYYSNLTARGGTDYTENEVATPLITPNIKGHAKFATNKGIGWFRSDTKLKDGTDWYLGNTPTKTRRILEVQSDLFQKGRDKSLLIAGAINKPNRNTGGQIENEEEFLTGGYYYYHYIGSHEDGSFKEEYSKLNFNDRLDRNWKNKIKISKEEYGKVKKEYETTGYYAKDNKNQFLQLLNKDNNWVTFFIKSIVQDSAKKGYEKVWFPTGNTAVQIEAPGTGIETIESAKEQYQKGLANTGMFYETTVTNILVKNYGQDNIKIISDEFGVEWREVTIKPERDLTSILLQKSSPNSTSPSAELNSKLQQFLDKIGVKIETLGEGDFVAKAKLVEKIIQVVQGKADISTLPEEAAHFFVDLLKANGTLYDQLMVDIENNPIYSEVYAEYKTIYLTENGNPDVTKIKEEAVGKLIARNIVKLHQANTEKSLLQRALNMIAAVIKKGLAAIGINNFSNMISAVQGVDVYEQVADKILRADVSGLKLDLPASEYELYQKTNVSGTEIANAIKNSQNLISEAKTKKEGVETVHYYSVFEGTPKAKDIYGTPSNIAGQDSRKRSKYRVVTAKQEADWEKIRQRGTKVHSWAEEIINSITLGRPITTAYNKLGPVEQKLYNKLEGSIKALASDIKKTDPKAVFLPEVKVYDPNYKWTDAKGMKHTGLAGSIDLLVVHGDGTVSIYDWKTTSKGKDLAAISVFKEYEYSMQIALYKRALMDGNSAMGVPKVKGIRKSRVVLLSTDVDAAGALRDIQLTGEVPMAGEKTGNKRLDAKLDNLYKSFYSLMKTKPPADEGEKAAFYSRLDAIKDTIIALHTQKNYNKVLEGALDDLKYANDVVNNNNPELDDLAVADEIADMYKDILDYVDRSGLTADNLDEFRRIQDDARIIAQAVEARRFKYMQDLATSYGLGDIDVIQRQIGFMSKNFRAASQQNHPMIALLYEMAKRALYKTEQDAINLRLNNTERVTKLREWASGKGMSLQQAYDMIINKKSGHLISQFSQEFWTAKEKAIVNNDARWFKDNMEIDTTKYNEALAKYTEYVNNKQFFRNPVKNKEKQQELIAAYKAKNTNLATSNYAKIKTNKLSQWQSTEWQNLNKTGNEGLLEFYKYFTETTKELSTWLPGFTYRNNFIPSLRKSWVEAAKKIDLKSGGALLDKVKDMFTVNEFNTNIDENTGEIGNQIPVYFVKDLGSEKSYDLGMVLQMFGEMAYNHKNMSEIEEAAQTGLELTKGMRAYESSSFNPLGLKINPIRQEAEATKEANEGAADLYKILMNYYVYGVKTANPSKVTQFMDNLNKLTSHTLLGFSVFPAAAATVANIANTQIQMARGIYFNNKQYAKSMWMLSGGSVDKNTTEKVAYLYKLFNPQIDLREVAANRKLSSSIATRNISTDLLYIMLRKPDEINQNLVFLSMLQNTIITDDGKFMLKSDYAKSLRPANYYNKAEVSMEQRKVIDKEIAEKLKTKKSVIDLVQIKDGKASIEGYPSFDSEAILGYRQMVRQVNKSIIGNMDANDIFAAKTNVWGRAILLFRNWMPRMITERFDGLTYNRELGRAEMGRYKTMVNMLIGFHRDEANKLRWAMAVGIEEAAKLEYMKQIRLKPELADQISEMEFIDLYKENMKAQWVGMGITIGVLILLSLLAKYYDDDDEKTGMSKFTMKLAKRAYSEMSMFVNPVEALNILKSPSAATAAPVSVIRLFTHLSKEGWGQMTDNEDMTKKAHPFKYAMALTFLHGPSRFAETISDDYEDWINDTGDTE